MASAQKMIVSCVLGTVLGSAAAKISLPIHKVLTLYNGTQTYRLNKKKVYVWPIIEWTQYMLNEEMIQ